MATVPGQERADEVRTVADDIDGILREGKRQPHGARGIRRLVSRGTVLALVLLISLIAVYLHWRSLLALGPYHSITIETSKGDVVLHVYPRLLPETVANFERLVEAGFYDGLLWHRVEDWIVQTGARASVAGSAEPATRVPLETSPKLTNRKGSVGMARSAEQDSASTQFYILKADAPWLDSKYAVFGKVVSGMGVVSQIEPGDRVLRMEIDSSDR